MKSGSTINTIAILLLLLLLGFVLADLGILAFRDRLMPSQVAPNKANASKANYAMAERPAYQIIQDRNIFNSDQKVGDPLGSPDRPEKDAPPVKTALPIQLTGTIVHINPAKSVATILIKSKNEQLAVKVEHDFDGIGLVKKIERARVTFRNKASQRLEYVDLPDDAKLNLSTIKAVQDGEVTVTSPNNFEIKRDDVSRLTSNLPDLLQQARAVPRMGAGGVVDCWSMADIAPNSIFQKLGLKQNDCIKAVDGQRIDSPAKAMELYNALRGQSNSINLVVERSGKDENLNYSITQ